MFIIDYQNRKGVSIDSCQGATREDALTKLLDMLRNAVLEDGDKIIIEER